MIWCFEPWMRGGISLQKTKLIALVTSHCDTYAVTHGFMISVWKLSSMCQGAGHGYYFPNCITCGTCAMTVSDPGSIPNLWLYSLQKALWGSLAALLDLAIAPVSLQGRWSATRSWWSTSCQNELRCQLKKKSTSRLREVDLSKQLGGAAIKWMFPFRTWIWRLALVGHMTSLLNLHYLPSGGPAGASWDLMGCQHCHDAMVPPCDVPNPFWILWVNKKIGNPMVNREIPI